MPRDEDPYSYGLHGAARRTLSVSPLSKTGKTYDYIFEKGEGGRGQ